MPDRYFHVDVRFMHKHTVDRLHDKFGWAGVVTFLSLCAQAKTSEIPGTFIYENDAIGWAKLGFDGRRPDFTLDEFLTFTGQLKQTRKRRYGRVFHVDLTQYGRWQNDGRRQTERERKARYRAKTGRNQNGTPGGTPIGTPHGTGPGQRTRSISTPPYPPISMTPKTDPARGSWCPQCDTRLPPGVNLEDHLRLTHQTEAA